MTPAFKDRRTRVAAALLTGLKLWFVCALPVSAIGSAVHDDRLFLRLANTLLDGQWLGSYNQFTLAKGPAYSMFVASTIVTGIPLPLAQHLMYLLGCWLVVRALRPLLPGDAWALGLYALLAWQPMSYEMAELGRVLRQNIYTPFTLFVFAGLAALATRAAGALRVRMAWAAILGLAWGALWLTREESIWVVPATVMLAGSAVLPGWRRARWRGISPLLVAIGAASFPLLVVCAMNFRNYGWWGTVEFRAPSFLAAYGALNRVEVGPAIPQVPLSRAGREAIYGVSPAFAELRPWLEGDIGLGAATHSAVVTHLEPTQREIAGGWWMWALREAVAAAGHVGSAAEALRFYQRLADEVNAACDKGELPAGPPRASMLPPWRREYTLAAWRQFPGYFGRAVFFSDFTAHARPSSGDADSLRLFRDLTQWFLAPAPDAPVFNTTTSTIARGYRVAVLNTIGHSLRWLCIVVVLGGVAAWVGSFVRAVRRRSLPAYGWWFATAAAGTVLAIVLISLLVHVSSFPLFGPMAFAQAYPLLVLFGGVAIADFVAGSAKAVRPTSRSS